MQIGELLHVDFERLVGQPGDPKVLYPHIDVWQSVVVSLVEVSQPHPLVHQAQWRVLVLLLELLELVVVVGLASLVHHLAFGHPTPAVDIVDVEENEAEVEEEHHTEADPAKAVEHLDGVHESGVVIAHDLLY